MQYPSKAAEDRATIEKLREALYLALPYVEDHEGSEVYKAGAVAWAVATIRAALGEPKQ